MDKLIEYLPHIIAYLLLIVGYVIKYRLDMQRLELNNVQINKELDNMKKNIDIITSNISTHNISILEMRKEKEYESQVISELLSPILDKMNVKLTEYVDLKMSLVTKEIEQIKEENKSFKGDLKEILKDFKDHTEKIIDKLSDKVDKVTN